MPISRKMGRIFLEASVSACLREQGRLEEAWSRVLMGMERAPDRLSLQIEWAVLCIELKRGSPEEIKVMRREEESALALFNIAE